MTFRRALVPGLLGGLLLAGLLWWAGASTRALGLPGAGQFFGPEGATQLRGWLAPWSYGPPSSAQYGSPVGAPGSGQAYAGLHRTGMQVRYVTLVVFYLCGAAPLVRRLAPGGAKRSASLLLALWGWGLVAGTLAVVVSAPWLVASGGHGGFRLLPRLSGEMAAGRQVLVVAALVASVGALVASAVVRRGGERPSSPGVPVRAARLAATLGTAVVAVSLVVLSYEKVAARIQTGFSGIGPFEELGDLLRQWLLLGGWSAPSSYYPFGTWLLHRLPDLLLLAVVWWGLRLLADRLDRVTVPAFAVGAVSVTVLGLLLSQLCATLLDAAQVGGSFVSYAGRFGEGVPAALVFGLLAGALSAVVARPRIGI
ncbi:hypothetical protein OG897_33640 [Streptomyces sp. NBC_00237]|uniref:hypothetical protein n=1 Tax=Streptomyces sp. NBC_00237 TaxID=2975687 RepID=UPI00224F3307|nr:hypothetical protein [Streptomyces sp. NBC_00237]MCX5206337.1 hypothetical protein [Streptomyces sp. NBC_00237]